MYNVLPPTDFHALRVKLYMAYPAALEVDIFIRLDLRLAVLEVFSIFNFLLAIMLKFNLKKMLSSKL